MWRKLRTNENVECHAGVSMITIRSSEFIRSAIAMAAALGLCACSAIDQPQAQPKVNMTSAPASEAVAPPAAAPISTPPAKPVVREQDFSEAIRAFYGCLGRAANELDTTGADAREAGKALISACADERAKSIAAWSRGRPARLQAEYAKQRDPDDLEVATNLILNRRAKSGN